MWNPSKRILVVVLSASFLSCLASCHAQSSNADETLVRVSALLARESDADSLAAAAVLSITQGSAQALSLIDKAIAAAPTRADLIWLKIQFCQRTASCDSEPLEQRLRQMDSTNGAGWMNALARADLAKQQAEKDAALKAISRSDHMDIYWTTLIAHLGRAVAQTKIMSARESEVVVIGLLAAQTLPAYAVVSNACKGELLSVSEVVETCRGIAKSFQRGDTYVTEMIGVVIAKRVWPKNSPEWQAASDARALYEYRSKLFAELEVDDEAHAEKYLALYALNRREQDVILATIIAAGKSPFPPAR